MTVEYPFTLAQLAHILSALENERRNPNTKRNAIKAIERNAAQIGLTAEDVFDAADGLLSGRLSAADWRAQLRDESCGPTTVVTEPSAEPAAGARRRTGRGVHHAERPAGGHAGNRTGSRPDSKQARMIAMLQRPEGATVEQMAEAMGWARHYADARIMPR